MDETLFERTIQEVSQVTKLVTFHLMGEPLLHPKLESFVKICDRYQMRIFLVTNGVLLNDKLSELLLHPAFCQINFSLHSFPDNFPDRDPSLYLERIFSFTEAAFENRPTLFINYRLWNLQTVKGKGDQNLEFLQRIEDRFNLKFDSIPDVRKKKSYPLKERLSLHFDTEFTWPSVNLPVLGERGTCYGLSSHFGVLVDGTIVPCCLDKEGNIGLGNLSSASLLDILNTPRAKNILTGFRARKLVESLCQRCQYIERFSSSNSGSL